MERCNINLVQVIGQRKYGALLQSGMDNLLNLGEKYLTTISVKKSMKIDEFHFFRLLEYCMSFVL
ncbi:unnamed protein product [Staurois parvus]|uniref:Uncharacterized protein n=1 Tax=Staurois parvus TaxID=386267 RepID=A0ABN9DYI9_9NEOB|nr:unnamed protein product [Staurois parvus]